VSILSSQVYNAFSFQGLGAFDFLIRVVLGIVVNIAIVSRHGFNVASEECRGWNWRETEAGLSNSRRTSRRVSNSTTG
jgi:hypothetical protein